MSTISQVITGATQSTTDLKQSTIENKDKSAPGATNANATGTRIFIVNIPFKTTSEELKAHLLTETSNIVSTEIISYFSGRSKGCGLAEFKSSADVDKVINKLNNSSLGGRKIFIREDREPKGYTGANRTRNESTKNNNDTSTNQSTGSNTTLATTTASTNNTSALKTTNTQPNSRTNTTTSNTTNNNDSNNNSDKFVQVRNPRNFRGDGSNRRNFRGRGFRRGGRGRGGRSRNFDNNNQRQNNNDPCNLYVGNLPYATTDEDLNGLFVDFGQVVKATVAFDNNGRSRGFGTIQMAKADDAQRAIDELNDTDYEGRAISVRVDSYAT